MVWVRGCERPPKIEVDGYMRCRKNKTFVLVKTYFDFFFFTCSYNIKKQFRSIMVIFHQVDGLWKWQ